MLRCHDMIGITIDFFVGCGSDYDYYYYLHHVTYDYVHLKSAGLFHAWQQMQDICSMQDYAYVSWTAKPLPILLALLLLILILLLLLLILL